HGLHGPGRGPGGASARERLLPPVLVDRDVARERHPRRPASTAVRPAASYPGRMTAPARATRTALWARLDEHLADGALALAVTLVIAVVIATDPAGVSPLVGLGCAAVFGALLLGRRRLPVIVLMVTILLIFVYYAA